MTTRFDAIDLGAIAAPDIVETIDFETILADRKAKARELFDAAGILPDWDPDLESDPIVKLLEEAAYRETVLRQRVNDAARAVMLPTATGTNLDNISARYHVSRQIITPADDAAIPPVPAVKESNTSLRSRTLLAFEALSVAGPEGAYKFHAISAHPLVYDVDVYSPAPGEVVVTVMTITETGIPDQTVLNAVAAALNDEDVRPLTDKVTVQAAASIDYGTVVVLDLYGGPDAEVVRTASNTSLNAFIEGQRRLGEPVTIDGIHKAARVDGVRKATAYMADGVTAFDDVAPAHDQFANCTSLTVQVAGDA